MGITVEEWFEKKYSADVHLAYQRMGTKLRETVRLEPNVQGSTFDFRKAGKGSAGQKTRHGNVPVMNLEHSYVTAAMEDWYAGEYADDLDLIKTSANERQTIVNSAGAALGRKTDELITTALQSGAGTSVGSYASNITRNTILEASETLDEADVPRDGQRFLVISPHQHSELMTISEYVNADFVQPADLPWSNGTRPMRYWNDFWVIVFSGLPTDSSDTTNHRDCFAFHRPAIGMAENSTIQTTISWENTKSAFFFNSRMSQGAVAIDGNGIVKIQAGDDVAIST